ncbi:MAG: hypothetical protein ACTH36_09130 [Pseudoalteromonas nigrifaciens]|uniref:hypothetical protein n=1 Tax=Pseudoalteromonas nigrifaciens TaxID=28109 RepID=UPI001788421C|nr:hypothetical protein [Pseudoalteromonas nigrifaciens]MBE0421337.1 hypothetical protein [Pseudoalteromonas nigrifaciens]
MDILTTLKIGKSEYVITEQDKFCANELGVTLLYRARVDPELHYKHMNQINKFERVQHEHKFGSSISIFSLK